MAVYTTIDDPAIYFNTKLYTGTGSSLAITGVGFQPDWIWFKERGAIRSHALVDSVRTRSKVIFADLTSAEETSAASTNDLKSFDSDGFTVGVTNVSGSFNTSSGTHVAWNWKAGTSFTNDASSTGVGSIDSAGSVSTDAGFSICSYTGTGSNATVKHGLSTAPKMIIFKNRNTSTDWDVYHGSLANTERLHLNTTGAKNTAAHAFNSTSPTTAVFSVGNADNTNKSSSPMIAYCFAEKQGYSKFGSYTGNGNADGTFVYTGFKPAMVIGKASSRVDVWWMHDNKRDIDNPVDLRLMPHSSGAEGAEWDLDYLSNGFKIRDTDAQTNGSGETYIYMAFAENPFVNSNGVPGNAR